MGSTVDKSSETMNHPRAFSVIELMIVVGIIGILAAIAIPQFRKFSARARQTEARTMVTHIRNLEFLYRDSQGSFALMATNLIRYGRSVGGIYNCDPNAGVNPPSTIGFSIQPCDPIGKIPRYGYFVLTGACSGGLCVIAESVHNPENLIVPGCNISDVVAAYGQDESHHLIPNAVESCD